MYRGCSDFCPFRLSEGDGQSTLNSASPDGFIHLNSARRCVHVWVCVVCGLCACICDLHSLPCYLLHFSRWGAEINALALDQLKCNMNLNRRQRASPPASVANEDTRVFVRTAESPPWPQGRLATITACYMVATECERTHANRNIWAKWQKKHTVCHDSKTGPQSTTPKFRSIKRVYLNIGSPRKFQRNKVQLKVAAERETKIGFRKTENHSYAGKKDSTKITTMLELQTRTKD